MAEGRKFTVNSRDESMLTSLFFAPYQRTDQIQQGHFDSFTTCKDRLYKLSHMKLVEPWTPWRRCTVWKLTKSGWEREAGNFGRRGERHRKWPKEESLKHFLEVNDFYVGIAAELDETFGRYPNWEWKDEPKSYSTYPLPAKKKGYHRPDAEIHIGDLVFFLERQTERSRKTQETFDKKCADYKRYIEYTERDPQKTYLVFACDTERDAQYAHNAAVDRGLGHIWGGVDETIDAILEIAGKASTNTKT